MKGYLRLATGVALVAAAAWMGFWYAGKGKLEARLDSELIVLEADGYAITYEGREVTGFPFEYRVTFTDVTIEDGRTMVKAALPSLVAEVAPASPDHLVLSLPDEIDVEIPSIFLGGEETAPSVDVKVLADGMVATIREDRAREVALRARAARLTADLAEEDLQISIDLMGIDAVEERLAIPVGKRVCRVTVNDIDFSLSTKGDEDAQVSLSGRIADTLIAGETERPMRRKSGVPRNAAFATAANAPGKANFVVQTGETALTLAVDDASPTMDGTVQITAGTASGRINLRDTAATLSLSAEATAWDFQQPDQRQSAGRMTMDSVEAVYSAPIAPAVQMQPLIMRLTMSNLQPDEALWEALDAQATLPRGPWEVVADVEGTARMLDGPTGLTGRPQVEIGNLSVNTLRMSALGAETNLQGDLTFADAGARPVGKLNLRLTRVIELIGKLFQAGLIDDPTAQKLALQLATMTRRTDERALESDIEFTAAGQILINGEPLSALQ